MTKLIIKIIAVLFICFIILIYWLLNRYSPVDIKKSKNFYYTFFKTEIHYQTNGNWFGLANVNLVDLDVKKAQILNEYYIKDDKVVYFEGTKINNADAGSFQVLDYCFAKDKNTVYYLSNFFEGIDVNTFKIEKDRKGYVRDEENLYSYKSLDHRYSVGNEAIKPLPKGYIILTENYGYVNNVLYYNEQPIAEETSNHFLVLQDNTTIKGDSNIYVSGHKVINLDAKTYQILEGNSYCKDKNGVYFGYETIQDKEEKVIGLKAIKITEADPETFDVIMEDKRKDLARDKNHTYWGGKIHSEKENK